MYLIARSYGCSKLCIHKVLWLHKRSIKKGQFLNKFFRDEFKTLIRHITRAAAKNKFDNV